MDQSDKIAQLLTEYEANVALWQHDDTLRQARTANFLTVNTTLLVALGAFVSLGSSVLEISMVVFLIAVFGFIICNIWESTLVRNAEYIRFRRFQLREIEAHLSEITTFTNTYAIFYQHNRILFDKIQDSFALKNSAKISSTLTEGRLPVILRLFWFLLLLVSIIVFIVAVWSLNIF